MTDLSQDAVAHEVHAGVVATVEIDGSHEGLEGVAAHIAVMGVGVPVTMDEGIQAQLVRQAVQGVALHNLAARVGQEALAPVGEVTVEDVTDNRLQHRITQVLQTLVVISIEMLAVATRGLMLQGQLIVSDAMGIEAQYLP